MEKEKSNKISVYLVKKEAKEEEIFKNDIILKELSKKDDNHITYYLSSKSKPPEWLGKYFNKHDNFDIMLSNAKAISVINIKFDNEERKFLIPFGHGKSIINEEIIEEQFGLIVLLNSINDGAFRQVDRVDYSGTSKSSTVQMPKKSAISEFEVDIHSDLIRKATAKTEEEIFNKNVIVGGDLLSASVTFDDDTIEEFLKFCYSRYKEEKYKENFDWIDNIKEVKSAITKESLNEKLIEEINSGNKDKIWMTVPEIIEWERIKDFRYSITKDGKDDINIDDFLDKLPNRMVSNINCLTSRKVFAMANDSDEVLKSWNVYKCIVGEIEFNNEIFCINNGKWYQVNDDFVEKTNHYYEQIELSDIEVPDCNVRTENEYNKLLSNNLPGSVVMDCHCVQSGDIGNAPIELCDVLSNSNELIHVKKNGGSSQLSHLFNQALVSGDLLQDIEFRKNANVKIKEQGSSINFTNDFYPRDYSIVIAIITNKNQERPKIPFFSKVSIRYSIEPLKRKGYKVKLKNILSTYE